MHLRISGAEYLAKKSTHLHDSYHGWFIDLSPLQPYTNMYQQEKSIFFVIFELSLFVCLLSVFENPGSQQIHALAIANFMIKMSIGHQDIKKRILTLCMITSISFVSRVCSLQVNCDVMIQLVLGLFARIFLVSVEVE